LKLTSKVLIALFIMVISLSLSKAQNISKREVVLLKESPNIDSLILSLINIPYNLTAAKNDSCFLLTVSKGNSRSSVQALPAFNKRTEITSIGRFEKDKTLGYFEIYGYLVFVCGDDFMNEFFERTKTKRTFVFRQSNLNEMTAIFGNYMGWAIFYRDGEFNYGVH